MKKLLTIALIGISGLLWGQRNEFKTYPNGLIYSGPTMEKLSVIVDSLDLMYKTCDFDPKYHSVYQAVGGMVRLSNKKVLEARRDMENGISFEAFLEKYPEATAKKETLIVRFAYENYRDEDVIEFSELDMSRGNGQEISFNKNPNLYRQDLKNKWVFNYSEKSEYTDENIRAFYFPNGLESRPLDQKYAKMVAYADCMVDTTTSKFNDIQKSGWVDLPKNWKQLSVKKQEKLLDQMRSTRVVGSCSQDSRPRDHAVNIAMVSAETGRWEVFLKAHLDIMNDRFERASDGSYAWAQRQTYIKELEALNINVPDLIMGTSLRIEAPAKNHYYANIRRTGRALAETRDREEIEQRLLAMIEDPVLDDYNRVIAYFLFLNYNQFNDENNQKENIERLRRSTDRLPLYLKTGISFEEN